MTDTKSDQVLSAARKVARDWVTSPYYSDAERWTWVFWDPGTVFRKLFDRLPPGRTVDLACGHGRHSEKMLELGREVIAMDIVPENVEFTAKRLQGRPGFSVLACNGVDFQPLPDHSVDAIVCYDAMVHFDCDVVQSYLRDSARILRPGGMGIFHHSNYDGSPASVSYGKNPHARNFMSAALFTHFAYKAGLEIVEQVVIPWGKEPQLDCVSLFRVRQAGQ